MLASRALKNTKSQGHTYNCRAVNQVAATKDDVLHCNECRTLYSQSVTVHQSASKPPRPNILSLGSVSSHDVPACFPDLHGISGRNCDSWRR